MIYRGNSYHLQMIDRIADFLYCIKQDKKTGSGGIEKHSTIILDPSSPQDVF
jgi:hypothetical protein